MPKNRQTSSSHDFSGLDVANAMNEALWVGDKDHKTVYISPIFEDLSGYTLKESIGKDCTSFFDEETKKKINQEHQARKVGKTSRYEGVLVSKNGKRIPLLISGLTTKDGGTIGIFTNLTEIKELSKQEKLARQILKNSNEAIVTLNEKRNITMWSAGATRLFGYTEEELLNKSIDCIIPDEEHEMNKQLLDEVERKRYLRNYEGLRMAKDGSSINVSISITKVLDEKDHFVGYLVIYQNITEQKRINSELQKRFEAIQDAYKELGLHKRQTDYLFEISDMAVSPENLESLERLIVSAVTMLTKADGTTLRLYDERKQTLRLKASLGVSKKWLDKNQIKFPNSIAEKALKNGRPIIIDNVEDYPAYQGTKLLKAHKFTTLVLIPLFTQKRIIGTLSIYATNPGRFRFIETDFLEKFGKQCSLALSLKIS